MLVPFNKTSSKYSDLPVVTQYYGNGVCVSGDKVNNVHGIYAHGDLHHVHIYHAWCTHIFSIIVGL